MSAWLERLLTSTAKAPDSPKRFSLWSMLLSRLGLAARLDMPRRDIAILPAVVPARPSAKAGGQAVRTLEKDEREEQDRPVLAVYDLGPFRVYLDDKPITDWPSGKGKAIFKYMIANRGRPISKDVLMDLFWRDADREAARNNLNVAIYGLRRAFRAIRSDFFVVLFEDDHYLLNPATSMWVDFEQFVQCFEAGQRLERLAKLAEAIRQYEAAESLYQGDFLEEDLYEDWPIPHRENLKDRYLLLLDRLSRHYLEEQRYTTCIQLCQKILARDDCREDAHRRLMQCYSRQGQPNLALRQYDLCVEALARTLDVPPMQETIALCEQIRKREAV